MQRLLCLFCLAGLFFAVPETAVAMGQKAEPATERLECSRPPLVDVTKLEIEKGKVNWRRDWWKYSAMILSTLISLSLLVYLTKMLFKLLSLLLCILAGGVGAYLCGNVFYCPLNNYLPEALTNSVPALYCLYVLGFILGYVIGIFLCTIFKKPVQKDRVTVKK